MDRNPAAEIARKAARAGKGPPVPRLPDWMLVVNAMRMLHLSERQVLEDCSPGMLHRVMLVAQLEDEAQEADIARTKMDDKLRQGGR